MLKPSWFDDDTFQLWLRCPYGHLGTLVGHTIQINGDVNPSVMCPSCDWHSEIRLLDWPGDWTHHAEAESG